MKKNRGILNEFIKVRELGAVIPLVLIVIIAMLINPAFIKSANIFDILKSTSYTMMMGVPLTLLLASGRMDLSIASTTALGGILAAIFQAKMGMPLSVAILLACAVGALIGYLNSVLVDRLKLPGFIATLAMSNIVMGVASVVTNNQAISGISDGFKKIAQTRLFGGQMTVTVIYALLIGIVGHLVLSRTKYGRKLLAVGGNAETASLAGISVVKIHTHMYVLVGIFAALSGVLYASRFSSAQMTAGSGTNLTILSSVIIGGTSMRGGSGTVLGSVLGCILFATITNSLVLMDVSTTWQNVVYGLILVAALLIDYLRQRSARRA